MMRKGVLRVAESGRCAFWCPGCEEYHSIRTRGQGAWGFNGNYDAPTFTPSVLVEGTRFTERGEQQHEAWVAAGCQSPPPEFERTDNRCHSFVTDGKIQFLSDSKHKLAGQTVPLVYREP
ncbi:MAG TPA: DUF6527 family protein [Steroidobacteraceae bacterium]|nr:DUF6527 family protein [Steroidobacteraceae bacterium]